MAWFLVFFFVSGLCSVLYELIWLRLAMAQFGVTSALVSIVLSMFMAGLGLGSWASGLLIRRRESNITFPPLRLYALTELLIGVSAVAVPSELAWGRTLLSSLPLSSSAAYYLASGAWIALTLIPWCACMGATFPVAMLAIRSSFPAKAQRSFSYLYVANVAGAVVGALLPLLLIEVYGFRGTLKVGAAMNVLLAASAFALTLRPARTAAPLVNAVSEVAESSYDSSPDKRRKERKKQSKGKSRSAGMPLGGRSILALLFGTGCASMGIEVVWIRQFTPYMGTVVYAFAIILAVYLLSTFLGSVIYRRRGQGMAGQRNLSWVWLGFTALLSSVTASPQFHLPGVVRLILGVAPFSGVLGFVTPMLVDRWSGGDPEKAGSAYAMNVMGCIVGPLLSGFLLLPWIGERWVALIFALPWLAIGANPRWLRIGDVNAERSLGGQAVLNYALIALSLIAVFISKGFEDRFAQCELLRDNTATVIATGEDMGKRLLVNGVGMSLLTPITKMMAHLPLAFLDHPPQKALVICFGMGTTFRSLLSWNISATAVELVPSVPRMFWYYHPDGPELMRLPLAHVVIDDGRRYLERTSDQYDVITIDPPPPLAAAGSSLLYSREFYAAIKQHLLPGGILQQWLPYGDAVDKSAIAQALRDSFPYIRAFERLPNAQQVHFIASRQPFPSRTPNELVSRMPAPAVEDMMEWGPEDTPEREFAALLDHEIPIDSIIAADLHVPALQDDRPANEYYVLRRYFGYQTVERLAGQR